MLEKRFAARLRELREAAGLSRKELAERAGMISEAGIRDLEQAHRSPSWKTVVALATALGVDCTAFTQEPTQSATEPRKPGRPRKPTDATDEPQDTATASPTTPVEASEPPAGQPAPAKKPRKKKSS